jgi:L-alanine-DL-glutamate epimerase-like enolase superfamily enzyme
VGRFQSSLTSEPVTALSAACALPTYAREGVVMTVAATPAVTAVPSTATTRRTSRGRSVLEGGYVTVPTGPDIGVDPLPDVIADLLINRTCLV